MLDIESKYHARLLSEMIHIKRNRNAMDYNVALLHWTASVTSISVYFIFIEFYGYLEETFSALILCRFIPILLDLSICTVKWNVFYLQVYILKSLWDI